MRLGLRSLISSPDPSSSSIKSTTALSSIPFSSNVSGNDFLLLFFLCLGGNLSEINDVTLLRTRLDFSSDDSRAIFEGSGGVKSISFLTKSTKHWKCFRWGSLNCTLFS